MSKKAGDGYIWLVDWKNNVVISAGKTYILRKWKEFLLGIQAKWPLDLWVFLAINLGLVRSLLLFSYGYLSGWRRQGT